MTAGYAYRGGTVPREVETHGPGSEQARAKRKALGEAIRARRKAAGLRQADLAATADVSVPQLSAAERGERCSAAALARVAAVFGTTPDDLLNFTNPAATAPPGGTAARGDGPGTPVPGLPRIRPAAGAPVPAAGPDDSAAAGRQGFAAGGDGPGVAAGEAVTSGARTWTLEMPAGMKLLSPNGRYHWAERHRRSAELRKAAWALARQQRIPPLQRASVVAEYQPPDRRHRDADNLAAAFKPAIDGALTDAGVLPGDDSRYLTQVTYRIGEPYPKGRLVLTITEVVTP